MKRALIALLIGLGLLSLIGVVVKSVQGLPPLSVAFFRAFFAFIFLGVAMGFLHPKFLRVKKEVLPGFALTGFFWAATMAFFTASLYFLPVANALILNYTYPFLAALLAWAWLKEKTTRAQWACMGVAFIGLVVMNPLQEGTVFGSALALLAGSTYACMLVLMRKNDQHHNDSTVFWYALFASVFLAGPAVLTGFGNWLAVWPSLLILGMACTGMAYLCITFALQRLHVSTVAITGMIVDPPVSSALAFMVLNEIPKPQVLAGGALIILAGVLLAYFSENKTLKKIKVRA